ncbi:MAG: TetR/AcrR family transcriptional regulator [Actinomycetota bacterium]|nr:TetR/AcrR family transcriptional regulator [Actinomycetota bacterium]
MHWGVRQIRTGNRRARRHADGAHALVALGTALTRTELLEVAERRFHRDGYHSTRLEAIAEEAGYTKGAVGAARHRVLGPRGERTIDPDGVPEDLMARTQRLLYPPRST